MGKALPRAAGTVVVGAGPTGVEVAGQLAELSRRSLRRNFRNIDPAQARVVLLDAGPTILPSFPESLRARATEDLREVGVEIHVGTMVTGVDERGVELEAAVAVGERHRLLEALGELPLHGCASLRLGHAADVHPADGRPGDDLPGAGRVVPVQGCNARPDEDGESKERDDERLAHAKPTTLAGRASTPSSGWSCLTRARLAPIDKGKG